jgi:DNA end-binding protein Ku
MPRAVWKGNISFGLVYIPVAVYPATREEKVSFKQLRKSDLSPIRYRKVAEADEKEVPAAEIVKGFEYEKGKYVTLTEEDFEKVQIESTHSVEINEFVELSEINPKFFYKPYFLEAQKGGEKAYALLHRALRETGKVGVAKVAIQKREYLASVKPDGLFLILELMHFAQEVLDPGDLKPAVATDLSEKEVGMAKTLIDSMSSDWEPERYADRYQEAVREIIEAKVAQRPLAPKVVARPQGDKVVDLLAVLQESLRTTTAAAAKSKAEPRKGGPRSTATLVKAKRRAA